ncbi:sigma-70 family RNA polymerase sigma factor [Corallococcus sp. AB004]|uniref:sigma-70 family RNA polymerase sigma factor n=1 Tax=Corallococcus sp. AB038B TaxID=2316718 RepID=UPI000EA2A4EC|nr:sigma-70 family RNA polymerase sigma factor [Corallococcus sp. AB038B]RKH94984.1 sigma-70 family RNA polymerase sigma factor [Corallococcus sp. AB038B]RKI45910.1 sigma-70 family RNA polymerase sigma factor [Corallococcus sp. AB004]
MAQQGESRPPPRRTAGWQLVLVAVALTIFSVRVVIPGIFVGIGATGLMGFAIAAVLLERMGALSAGIFEGAAQLSVIFLGMALIAFVAITGWNGYRRLAGRVGPPPLLLRSPWALVGLLLFLACKWAIPDAGERLALPVLSGAIVIAFSVWTLITVSVLLFRMSIGMIRLSWRIAQASPFGAGGLTLAALAATGLIPSVDSLAEALPARAQTVASARPARCDSLSWECSRQALLAAQPSRPAPVFAAPEDGYEGVTAASFTASADSTVTLNTRTCLERQFQQREMMAKARRIAQGLVGTSDAEDLVHSILLNICLRKRPPDEFEQFFLRSVQYGAMKRFGRVIRSCSIDESLEPQCTIRPDDQYIQLESHQTLHDAICALPEKHQEIIQMRYFEELSDDEIGARLGLLPDAVRKRTQRARDQLRTIFLQQCQ